MYFSGENKLDLYQEGAAKFVLGEAFYRESSRISRDLGVLVAQVYRQRAGRLRVLDGMSGAGVRSLRYALEAEADFVWANEGNPDLGDRLQQNLAALPADRYCLSHRSLEQLLGERTIEKDYFDLIDLDAFGSPLVFLQGALRSIRYGGLLYLTSTDGRSISGQLPEQSLRQWGAWIRSHPAVQEQALRLLLGAVVQQAALMGLGIEPVFSLYRGQVYRVMVRVLGKQNWQTDQSSGFLGYCHSCGNFQTLAWRQLGQAVCDCTGRYLSVSGPLWLGPLHGVDWLTAMGSLAQEHHWDSTAALIQTMQAETPLPPYYYPLGEIGRRGKMDLPKRDRLIQALIQAGYQASPTHIHSEAIKTNAPFPDCIALAQTLS
ncbi:MAG: tRNA (guanine-N1)-methyltransferase [Alkalinema sp. RU_4_3]|nr:tRNA (guanine-N1)-methyltransferase [Alkalinema sp. RU_4_3]